ncbi:hypothetical protein E5H25_18210 [Acinetobacter baumannii]|uniref:hypothetical protein n=1 Tax=Acinetobacter baumannii TaxID=470 RepID=UPI0010A2E88E|nr:hypothetical protein [Acinetobacter baumannii]MDB0300873.1 hypothetical protein [Acinetobacter baumannii]MDO7242796.1 hypothetical protein [Acinetobacter baumannii]THD86682.1 hypothetical protein E5H25_18210 [Acinetobacter baumannii]HAV4576058.1 hypothetical protein [Acinetobacter baumannii]HDQ4387988.1 hypothetical protein [Acinetobacter baumannii]
MRQSLEANKAAIDFRKLPPSQQESQINQLKAQLKNTDSDDPSSLKARLDMFQTIANEAKALATSDAASAYTQRTGQSLYRVETSQLINGQFDVKQAQSSVDSLRRQQKELGYGSLNPFTTTQQKEVREKFHDSDINTQKVMIQNLAKIAGTDNEARKQMYDMIYQGRANVYSGINQLAIKDVHIPGSNIKAADLALEGLQLQANGVDKTLAPSIDSFKTKLAEEAGNALQVGTPEFEAYANLIYSTYVAYVKRTGVQLDDKGKPRLDERAYQQSQSLITGGYYKQKVGSVSNTVPVPYGMGPTEFGEKVEEQVVGGYYHDTGVRIPRGFMNTHALRKLPGTSNQYMFIGPDGKPHINPRTNKPYIKAITK